MTRRQLLIFKLLLTSINTRNVTAKSEFLSKHARFRVLHVQLSRCEFSMSSFLIQMKVYVFLVRSWEQDVDLTSTLRRVIHTYIRRPYYLTQAVDTGHVAIFSRPTHTATNTRSDKKGARFLMLPGKYIHQKRHPCKSYLQMHAMNTLYTKKTPIHTVVFAFDTKKFISDHQSPESLVHPPPQRKRHKCLFCSVPIRKY